CRERPKAFPGGRNLRLELICRRGSARSDRGRWRAVKTGRQPAKNGAVRHGQQGGERLVLEPRQARARSRIPEAQSVIHARGHPLVGWGKEQGVPARRVPSIIVAEIDHRFIGSDLPNGWAALALIEEGDAFAVRRKTEAQSPGWG